MDLLTAIRQKKERMHELEAQLANPSEFSDQRVYARLSSEYKDLCELMRRGEEFASVCEEIARLQEMTRTESAEMQSLVLAELAELETKKTALEQELTDALHPPSPLDAKNSIIEIRAGAGGDESALFASELLRMYSQYAVRQGWKTALLSESRNDIGGYKEVIVEVSGKNVYSKLKWESGVHRVQRVPETEKAGRIHTSTVTVAVLPKFEELDFTLDPKELKIETSTARGHGGQSVNTTYSAIRMTHIPTGITVSCQDERSQTQNRERALAIMRSRVFDFYEEKRKREHSDARRAQIGTGDRSEKIRTYNFPQDRLTDHRIKISWHNITQILEGDLDPVVAELRAAERALMSGHEPS